MVIRLIVESLSDVANIKQMIHDPDGVVAQLLGHWPEGQDLLRIVDAPVIGNGHTKFHPCLPGTIAIRPQEIASRIVGIPALSRSPKIEGAAATGTRSCPRIWGR